MVGDKITTQCPWRMAHMSSAGTPLPCARGCRTEGEPPAWAHGSVEAGLRLRVPGQGQSSPVGAEIRAALSLTT